MAERTERIAGAARFSHACALGPERDGIEVAEFTASVRPIAGLDEAQKAEGTDQADSCIPVFDGTAAPRR
jgi:hypothetical protein